jgi:hypothetical protein
MWMMKQGILALTLLMAISFAASPATLQFIANSLPTNSTINVSIGTAGTCGADIYSRVFNYTGTMASLQLGEEGDLSLDHNKAYDLSFSVNGSLYTQKTNNGSVVSCKSFMSPVGELNITFIATTMGNTTIARTGTCPAGQYVTTTSTTGVSCATPAGSGASNLTWINANATACLTGGNITTGGTVGVNASCLITTMGITNGTNGVNGSQGIQGIPGVNGTNGVNGSQGIQGVAGTNGTNGAAGTNGTNGINGVNGTNGSQGIQGIPGVNGTNGINGTNASIANMAGAKNCTAGYILKSINITLNSTNFTLAADCVADSTGNGSSPVTGTGIAGQFAVFNSSSEITSSLIYAANITDLPTYGNGTVKWINANATACLLGGNISTSGTIGVNASCLITTMGITNGTNGVNGSQGIQGIPGVNGTNGVNGSQGIQGVAGTNGTNGVNGTNASVTSGDTYISVASGVITFNLTTGDLRYKNNTYILGVCNVFNDSSTFSGYYTKAQTEALQNLTYYTATTGIATLMGNTTIARTGTCATGAVNATTTTGVTCITPTLLLDKICVDENKILKRSGSIWECQDDKVGTVTSVTCGTGMTGGAITSSGTCALNSSVIYSSNTSWITSNQLTYNNGTSNLTIAQVLGNVTSTVNTFTANNTFSANLTVGATVGCINLGNGGKLCWNTTCTWLTFNATIGSFIGTGC